MADVDPGPAGRLAALTEMDLRAAFRLRGTVLEVGDGVARVAGLPEVGHEELVAFDSGGLGMAYDLALDYTGVVLLSGPERVGAAMGVSATGRPPSVPVGPELLGRVIDPLGRPLDDRPASGSARCPVFREAPKLTERASVRRPLLTGVMVIDTAIPIGRGQRQLVAGDRNVGKTALALDIVTAQKAGDVACVYVVIGQPLARVLGIREALLKSGAWPNTVLVAADAAATPGMQYLAPYAGTAVAEGFRDQGLDALVVYDDLTKHADAYRELALLLGRPPGREAFPGDIFYVHAELLERAAALSPAAGGGSMTALPIAETIDGDISAYIPTNLISITDGQIYLDAPRFERNQRPAVDIGRSVSRVGGAAQPAVMRAAARNLRVGMARFESLEALTRVGLDVDPATRQSITRGRIMRELLRQPRFTVRRVADQVLALTAAAEGWLDDLPPAQARHALWAAAARARAEIAEVMEGLESGQALSAGWKERLRQAVQRTPETSR